jgi:hypothetical protein
VSGKRRGPDPTGKGEPILTRLQPDLIACLDAFIASEGDNPSKPEAIRRILKDWFISRGRWVEK